MAHIIGKWHRTVADCIFQKKTLKHFWSMCSSRELSLLHQHGNLIFPSLEIEQAFVNALANRLYQERGCLTSDSRSWNWYGFCLNLSFRVWNPTSMWRGRPYHVKVFFPMAPATVRDHGQHKPEGMQVNKPSDDSWFQSLNGTMTLNGEKTSYPCVALPEIQKLVNKIHVATLNN